MTNPLNSIYNNILKTNELSNKFKLKIRDLKLGGVSKKNLKTKKFKKKKSRNLKNKKNKTINNKPLQRANNILKNYYRQKYSS